MNADAVTEVSGCLPLIIPADPRHVSVAELMEVCDGFLLTGEYGEAATEAHGAFDRARDAIVLPLVRACVERGQPFLGICRGFQEVNVAMGGTLYPEIRDLPGRMNHRMPPDGMPRTARRRRSMSRGQQALPWRCNGIRSGMRPVIRSRVRYLKPLARRRAIGPRGGRFRR